ncbi:hypothetical protein YB2330_003642 [Saitoella coloradoensis]
MALEFDLVIKNGRVVTASDIGTYDIGIKDGKIHMLGPDLPIEDAKRVIDAEGAYVTPGGVDAHVHLAEPAMYGKGGTADDYETGSRSAVCGGTTTIVTFAPQRKTDDSILDVVARTHDRATGQAYCDYSFHCIISNPSKKVLGEFETLKEQGITSLKLYMTYASLQLRDNEILDILLAARRTGITTMIHAENGDMIAWLTEKLEEHGHFDPEYHATSRPQLMEAEATNRAIAMAEMMDTPILIVHVSSPSAAAHIRKAQTAGLPIYAETCPQYLFLTRADLQKDGFEGAKCVCSPPPRDGAEDHEGIWRGLANGTFTILSSDHCPFRYEDPYGKKVVVSEEFPKGKFKYIPNGCPGVETRLGMVMSAIEKEEKMTMQKFVEVTCTNPAKLYGLYPRKGALLPGLSDADVTIWYPEGKLEPYALKNEMLHHDVDYTPFEGREVRNWPRYTILRGEVVWDKDGEGLVGKKGYGEFVMRGISTLAGPKSKEEWRPDIY